MQFELLLLLSQFAIWIKNELYPVKEKIEESQKKSEIITLNIQKRTFLWASSAVLSQRNRALRGGARTDLTHKPSTALLNIMRGKWKVSVGQMKNSFSYFKKHYICNWLPIYIYIYHSYNIFRIVCMQNPSTLNGASLVFIEIIDRLPFVRKNITKSICESTFKLFYPLKR